MVINALHHGTPTVPHATQRASAELLAPNVAHLRHCSGPAVPHSKPPHLRLLSSSNRASTSSTPTAAPRPALRSLQAPWHPQHSAAPTSAKQHPAHAWDHPPHHHHPPPRSSLPSPALLPGNPSVPAARRLPMLGHAVGVIVSSGGGGGKPPNASTTAPPSQLRMDGAGDRAAATPTPPGALLAASRTPRAAPAAKPSRHVALPSAAERGAAEASGSPAWEASQGEAELREGAAAGAGREAALAAEVQELSRKLAKASRAEQEARQRASGAGPADAPRRFLHARPRRRTRASVAAGSAVDVRCAALRVLWADRGADLAAVVRGMGMARTEAGRQLESAKRAAGTAGERRAAPRSCPFAVAAAAARGRVWGDPGALGNAWLRVRGSAFFPPVERASADAERALLKRRVEALQRFLSQEKAAREDADQRARVVQAQVKEGKGRPWAGACGHRDTKSANLH